MIISLHMYGATDKELVQKINDLVDVCIFGLIL